MKKQITILSVVIVTIGVATAIVINRPVVKTAPETKAYTSVDDEGNLWYITESKELRYVQRGFLQPIKGREEGLRVVLFDIRHRSKWYQGMDGVKSELKITAYLVDEFGEPDISLWTIQSKAHGSSHEFWSGWGYSTNVYTVIHGCCGAPTTSEVYDLCTGELIRIEEEVGVQPPIKWATKK